MTNSQLNVITFQRTEKKPTGAGTAQVKSINRPRFGREYEQRIRKAPNLTAKLRLMAEQFSKSIVPCLSLSNLDDLNIGRLRQMGDVRGVIFDLDDTLMPLLSGQFPPAIIEKLKRLKADGLKIGIVTNNIQEEYCRNARRQLQKANLLLPFIEDARKPDPQGFLAMRDYFGLKTHQIAVIGDGFISDIRCANLVGMKSVQATWFSHSLLGKPISTVQDAVATSFHGLRSLVSPMPQPSIIDPRLSH